MNKRTWASIQQLLEYKKFLERTEERYNKTLIESQKQTVALEDIATSLRLLVLKKDDGVAEID